jgi:hypothetical protein
MERRSTFSGIIIVICFMVGCFFLLLAVEEWIENNFDSNRYTLVRVRTAGSDSMTVWKLDKKTGVVEFCSKTSDIKAQVVCLKPVYMDASSYRKPLDPDTIAQPEPAAEAAADPVAPVPAPQPELTPEAGDDTPSVPAVPVKPEE